MMGLAAVRALIVNLSYQDQLPWETDCQAGQLFGLLHRGLLFLALLALPSKCAHFTYPNNPLSTRLRYI